MSPAADRAVQEGPGFLATFRRALERVNISPRALLPAVAFDLAIVAMRLVALALWLPLVHGLLTGRAAFGGRWKFLEALVPEGWLAGRSLPLLGGIAAAILLLTLGRGLLTVLSTRWLAACLARAELHLGSLLLGHHLRFGQSYYDGVPPATTTHHLLRLPRKVARVVGWAHRATGALLELLCYAAAMAWLAPRFAAVALASLALYYGVFHRLLVRAESSLADAEDLDEEAAEQTQDFVSNLLLYLLYQPRQATLLEQRRRAAMRAGETNRKEGLLELLDQSREALNVVLTLLFVLAAAWAVGEDRPATISRYVVFFFVLRRAMGTFSTLQRLPRQWGNLRRHCANLDQVLRAGVATEVRSGGREPASLARGVSLRRLCFSYPGGPQVLDGVTLDIAPGALTAVLGRNGSGKSTLVKLLLRLYDCAGGGAIEADGIDVREFDLDAWRSKLAFAGPEPLLLRGSLRENLEFGVSGEVSESRLAAAMACSGLGTALERIAGGLDAQVGPGGSGLSRGEQQMVALTRALLRDADLLLLDEATSSLDGDTDRAVLQRLEALASDRGVLVVTHRPDHLPENSRVHVLEGGRLVQSGLRRELDSVDGPFRRLTRGSPEPACPVAAGARAL